MALCECGCGKSTSIAKYSDSRYGWVRGQPVRFIKGHWRRGKHVGDEASIAKHSHVLPNGCVEWTAAKDKQGYALFTPYGQPMKRLARYLYTQAHGPLEPTQFVCHRCDNTSCINVAHLFVGTTQDNMDDMKRKERQARGEKHHKARLTEEQVREIRASHETNDALATKYNVNNGTIWFIRRGLTWKHVA